MAAGKDIASKLKTFTPAQLKAGLKTANMQRGASNFAYLKFDGRSGRLTVTDGNKETNIPDGTELAFNVLGSTQGYVCWNDGEIAGQFFKSFFEALPPIESMEDHGPYEDPEKDGWQTQYVLMFKDIKSNQQYLLRLNSMSGRKQVDKLYQQIGDQEALHDFTEQTPVITIDAEPFTSKGHKNYKPVFEIVSWVDTPKDSDAIASPINTAPAIAAPAKEAANKLDSVAIED